MTEELSDEAKTELADGVAMHAHELVTMSLRRFGLNLVFCDECGVAYNMAVTEDCPVCAITRGHVQP